MAKKLSPQEEHQKKVEKLRTYRNGGDGMIQWAEDNVRISITPVGSSIPKWYPMSDLPSEINPKTGRSFKMLWECQKKILREALRMEDGEFVYRLIVLCWMRGEGKTVIGPCLINLWKFFCFPKQKIVLAANSQNQTKFITFDLMTSIIRNSPNLNAIMPKHSIVNKEIRMLDDMGDPASKIMCGTAHTGIYSGATGYAFSEMFEMQNPEFFSQLDGSMRIVKNGLGVLDSTVSPKTHILYQLYNNFLTGSDPLVYFSYRCSPLGDYRDFWNPEYTQQMLDSYKAKSVLTSFPRYFQNLWSAGSDRLIDDEFVEEMYYVGDRRDIGNRDLLSKSIVQIEDLKLRIGQTGADIAARNNYLRQIQAAQSSLVPVDEKYRLTQNGDCCYADSSVLAEMGDFYDTDWAVLVGLDRADPARKKGNARSMMTATAKGMIGSRTRKDIAWQSVQNYLYLRLYIGNMTGDSLEEIKLALNFLHGLYDGIDMFTAEKFATWDLTTWADDYGVPIIIIAPSSSAQREAFTEYQQIFRTGRIKSPVVPIHGSNSDDIQREELQHFMAEEKGSSCVFGSDEKDKTGGVQDDFVYADAWGIYGGRNIGVERFYARGGKISFGASFEQEGLRGRYGG